MPAGTISMMSLEVSTVVVAPLIFKLSPDGTAAWASLDWGYVRLLTVFRVCLKRSLVYQRAYVVIRRPKRLFIRSFYTHT